MMMIDSIHNFYFDEYLNMLTVDFSTAEDGDEFFRTQEIDKKTFLFYSPENLDMLILDEDIIREMLGEYYIDNPLPEQQLL